VGADLIDDLFAQAKPAAFLVLGVHIDHNRWPSMMWNRLRRLAHDPGTR
jgi:hypothetical protein